MSEEMLGTCSMLQPCLNMLLVVLWLMDSPASSQYHCPYMGLHRRNHGRSVPFQETEKTCGSRCYKTQ